MTTATNFVLVHGAWGGAHTWRSVRPLLWSAGHHVFTPALTGIGERSHLASPQIDLTTHVDDIVNCIRYEDLYDIVLVGFSYGGMVITGAIDDVADRVRELVYLDAFVPTDGQAVVDLAPFDSTDDPTRRPRPGDRWTIPPGDRTFDDPDEQEFQRPRRTPQPIRTYTERVRLRRSIEEYAVGRTYIKAIGEPRSTDGPDAFWEAADRCRGHPAWRYEELPGNHMLPQNQPEALVEILLSLT